MDQGQLPLWAYAIRAMVVMLFLFLAFRLMGKRMAAQMNIYDLAMIMAVSNAVQNAMTGGRGELGVGLYASAGVILLAWGLTKLFVKAPALEKRLVGIPTILLNDGEILEDRLHHERVTEDELMEVIRSHGLTKPEEVMLAVLEVDGSISIIPKSADHHRTVKVKRGSVQAQEHAKPDEPKG
jgi:uncharacterized membrane protein YcaP (DUF421 family)